MASSTHVDSFLELLSDLEENIDIYGPSQVDGIYGYKEGEEGPRKIASSRWKRH